jgi:hypothetical protein
VLTKDKLLAAGPPDSALKVRAALDGKEGGRLTVVSTADGTVLNQYKLDTVPVYDGMAAAYGKLYLALQDGRLVCFGSGETE